MLRLRTLNMPNIKSAKKRVKTSERNTLRNASVRSRVRTALKTAREAIAGGDSQAIEAALRVAFSEVDRAVKRKIFHKNAGARYKSNLSRALASTKK